MAKYTKQKHGHVNPVMRQEEIALLAALARAQESTTNSQILGRNGERGMTTFLNRYLPSCFRTASGHFVTPTGVLSPEIDVLVLDARYPLLAENIDGSVVAMLHSVIATIEVKLTLVRKEIQRIRESGLATKQLCKEVFPAETWGAVLQRALAYRAGSRLSTLDEHFFADWHTDDPAVDLTLLRVHDGDQPSGEEGPLGAMLWLEAGEFPSVGTSLAPLSDFYYRLVQDAYYTLSHREVELGLIGSHMNEYMRWGTFPCTNRGA